MTLTTQTIFGSNAMTEDTKNILTECVHRLENVAATTSMTESYEINRIIGVIEALVEVGE